MGGEKKKKKSDPNCRSYILHSRGNLRKRELKGCVWGKLCAAVNAVFTGAAGSGVLTYEVF